MRTYFKVKPEYSGFTIYLKTGVLELIENELFTAHELNKYRIPQKCVEPIKVKCIRWFFGARKEG